MKRQIKLPWSFGILALAIGICVVISMSFGYVLLSANQIRPVQQQPLLRNPPSYTATVPNPLLLAPNRMNQFTITGNFLSSVNSIGLVNTRTAVWSLTANIVSRTTTAMTVTVDVPKYVALGPYKIQAVTSAGVTDTGLIAQANESKPSLIWTEFNPKLHGFSFGNSGWGSICFTLVGGAMVYSPGGPICDNNWGLCGGMSLIAGERFRLNRTDTHSLAQAAAKPDAVNGQFRTLDGPTVAKFLAWISSPDQSTITNIHSIGYRMQQDWNGLIKPQLDAYKPVVLGLIFDKETTVWDMATLQNVGVVTKQHQVLGIGYSRTGTSTVRLFAYDPNIQDDLLILQFTTPNPGVALALDSGRALSRTSVRGVMFVRSVQ